MSSSQIAMPSSSGQVTPTQLHAAPAQPAAAIAQPSAPIDAPAPTTPRVDPEANVRQLKETVDLLNQQMEKYNRDLGFSIDEKAGRNVVVVRSKANGEVVRQIPDETVLRVAHHIEDMKGILYNDAG